MLVDCSIALQFKRRTFMKTLYWIFPCYNEEECLPHSFESIIKSFESLKKEELINKDSKIVFVDDGSKDKTWDVISLLAKENKEVVGLKLSRNKGHQYAVEAGLQWAYEKKADLTITMDVDLQDDIDVTKEMIEKYLSGYDVVYGVRKQRKTDGFLKRRTAKSYYKLMRKLGVELVEEAADFRLLSYRATEALLSYHESNLFLRGIVPQIGYKSCCVEYDRKKRQEGKTHYSFSKMLTLAFDGMTSFSSKPLGFIGKFGCFIAVLSVIFAIVIGILNLTNTLQFSIFYYLFAFIAFNTGIVLIALWVVALYVGKINIEVKKRPHYFIEKTTEEK